jgi:HlyD family secretion protein
MFSNARVLPFALAVSILLSACGAAAGAVNTNARTTEVKRGSLSATVNATGNIQAQDEVKLAFQQAGLVSQVNVKVGDVVNKGNVIATLDTVDAEFTLSKAQMAVENAEAALVVAQTNYSRTIDVARPLEIAAAQSALAAAQTNYNRVVAGPKKDDFASAEARLRNAEAELRRAQSGYDLRATFEPASITASGEALQLEQATNNYNAAKAEFDKLMRPADAADKSAALRGISEARASLDKLRQPVRPYEVEKAQAEIAQAKIQIEQAQLEVKQAQRRIDQSKIVAPFDGVVSELNAKAGETFSGSQHAITLVDVSQLRIDVNVDEVDVAKVKSGQDVTIRLDALPGVELKGKVERISPMSKVVNGAVSYTARVALPSDAQNLKPGMTTNSSIVLEKKDGALLAPNWAVRKDKKTGKSYITIPEGDKDATKEIEVQIGLKSDTESEIVSGVDEGQKLLQPVSPTPAVP